MAGGQQRTAGRRPNAILKAACGIAAATIKAATTTVPPGVRKRCAMKWSAAAVVGVQPKNAGHWPNASNNGAWLTATGRIHREPVDKTRIANAANAASTIDARSPRSGPTPKAAPQTTTDACFGRPLFFLSSRCARGLCAQIIKAVVVGVKSCGAAEADVAPLEIKALHALINDGHLVQEHLHVVALDHQLNIVPIIVFNMRNSGIGNVVSWVPIQGHGHPLIVPIRPSAQSRE